MARQRYKCRFNKIKLVIFAPLLFLIVSMGISILLESQKYSGTYGELHDGLASGIEKYQKGGVGTALNSPATYRHEVEIKSDTDLIFFIPNALFQYWFEPMPWRINRVMDYGLFFENLLRAFLIWRALTGIRKTSGTKRNLMFFVFISYLSLEIIFSVGTMNWGTAVRHHIPAFGLLVLSAFIFKKHLKRKFKPLPSVTIPITSGN